MTAPPAVLPRSSTSTFSRLGEIFAVAIFVAYALLFFLHRQPPSLGDFGDWTYQGVLLRNHLLGLPDPAHALKPYPVPNSLTTLGIGLLALVLPWTLAARLWLGIYLLAALLSSRALIRAAGSSPVTWFLLPALFLNVNLWWGFLNFQFGICWVLLFIAVLLRSAAEPASAALSRRRQLLLAGLLCLLFFTHMIPFCFAMLLLGIAAVRTRRPSLLLPAVPLGLLTLWYIAGRFLFAGNADSNVRLKHIPFVSASFVLYKVGGFLKSFGLVNPVNSADAPLGPATLGLPLYLVFFACAMLLCAVLLLRFSRVLLAHQPSSRASAPASPARRLLAPAILVFLALFLVAPSDLLGIADPGARLLQVALYVLVFVPLPAAVAIAQPTRRSLTPHALDLLTASLAIPVVLLSLVLLIRLPFAPDRAALPVHGLPASVQQLAFVKYRIHAAPLRALRAHDLRAEVFPTGMFLNRPGGSHPLAPEPVASLPATPRPATATARAAPLPPPPISHH